MGSTISLRKLSSNRSASSSPISEGGAGGYDTVGNGGILIDGLNSTKEYQEEFIAQAIKLLTDDKYRNEWAEKANNKMREYSWGNIADKWVKEWRIKCPAL
jgi:glycosyltransferase involved in cell wall biosynthesis